MNFYSFHLGDYAAHTKHLSLLEDLAYRRMLDLYYTSEKPLPLEPERVARLIGMREYMQEVSDVLSDFFVKSETGYTNKRCDKEIEVYRAKAERAKSANKSRWEAERIERDLKSDLKSDADNVPTKNQEPRTKNQEPETITEPLKPESLKPKVKNIPAAIATADTATVEKFDLLQASRDVWNAYSTAYFSRYGEEPVQNAKVRSIVKQFIQRIGSAESPSVAAFYVSHNERFYVQKSHPVDLLLKDAEGLRTQWATGRAMTGSKASQVDRTASNADSIREAIEMTRRQNATI